MHDKTGDRALQDDLEDASRVKKVIADGAYQRLPPFEAGGRIEGQIVNKKATGGRFKMLPKRWIVVCQLADCLAPKLSKAKQRLRKNLPHGKGPDRHGRYRHNP